MAPFVADLHKTIAFPFLQEEATTSRPLYESAVDHRLKDISGFPRIHLVLVPRTISWSWIPLAWDLEVMFQAAEITIDLYELTDRPWRRGAKKKHARRAFHIPGRQKRKHNPHVSVEHFFRSKQGMFFLKSGSKKAMTEILSTTAKVLESLVKIKDVFKNVVSHYDVEGLYIPNVVDFGVIDKRLDSERVKFCDVMPVTMAFFTAEDHALYQTSRNNSMAMTRFFFPKIKETIELMTKILGGSTRQRIKIVFVCSNYRALKFAGIKDITYFFPSSNYMASVPGMSQDSYMTPLASSNQTYHPSLVRQPLSPFTPSLSTAQMGPAPLTFAFHESKEDPSPRVLAPPRDKPAQASASQSLPTSQPSQPQASQASVSHLPQVQEGDITSTVIASHVDPVAFAMERDDILKRKKDQLIIFNTAHELIDAIARHYNVAIRI